MSLNSPALCEGRIVKQPHEIVLHSQTGVALSLAVPQSLQGDGRSPYKAEIDSGTVHLTSQRIIYFPSKPSAAFTSFSGPILDFEDSYVSSPWFGSWFWAATVKAERPANPAGLPSDIPRVTIKLRFNDGGHDAFRSRFEDLKERLYNARDLQRELASLDDGLPTYDEAGAPPPPPSPPRAQAPAPTGPPPAYEE